MISYKNEAIVVLHNIRSIHNVGSIFRTCDALGISKVYLSGYTPSPTDRFGRVRKDLHKTALGAEETVSWEKVFQIGSLIKRLRKEGYFLVAVEQSPDAINYKNVSLSQKHPTAFIFGNEVRGLSQQILEKCDCIAEISMKGEKESLNVAVSVGIALFRILDI